MLVAIGSIKGAPGVTSTALALAAAWPRPVALVEADPSGGSVAYRCRAAGGGALAAAPSLLTLAAAVRGGVPYEGVLLEHAQTLGCGVNVVQGVTAAGQARGLGSLWATITHATQTAGADVVADLGRLDRTTPAFPVAAAADVVVVIGAAAMDSVMHLRAGLRELTTALNAGRVATVLPVLVGPGAQAARDRADLDHMLMAIGLPVRPAGSIAYDPKGLERLEAGEDRRNRTALARSARELVDHLMSQMGVPA